MSDHINTNDIFGANITCSNYHWYNHVAAGAHSIMRGNEHAIIDTISLPDEVYEADEFPDRKVFFKKSSFSTYDSSRLYTKVIVGYSSETKGEIITAFPKPGTKGGIGDVIYKKQN